MCVHVHMDVYVCIHVHALNKWHAVSRVREKLVEVSFLRCVGSGDLTCVIRLCDRWLYPLNRLPSPWLIYCYSSENFPKLFCIFYILYNSCVVSYQATRVFSHIKKHFYVITKLSFSEGNGSE